MSGGHINQNYEHLLIAASSRELVLGMLDGRLLSELKSPLKS